MTESDECSKRLEHYGSKAHQHLSRVRLSHVLAQEALRANREAADVQRLIKDSFDQDVAPDQQKAKLMTVLDEVHLVALKANFELYLNRVLTTVWSHHFEALVPKIRREQKVSARQIARSLLPGSASAGAKEIMIAEVVPRQGLNSFIGLLKHSTGIDFRATVNTLSADHWAQISAAFEVRHLVEHRDGKIDERFRSTSGATLARSSWNRHGNLSALEKITVDAEDVKSTYEAMVDSVASLTAALVRWDASKQSATPHRHIRSESQSRRPAAIL